MYRVIHLAKFLKIKSVNADQNQEPKGKNMFESIKFGP